MIVNKSFKEQVKIDPSLSKNSSEPITSKILEKKRTCSKNILAISFLSITLLSGCSVIGQTVASAADALKTDVQTQHDENFRIRRVRKALRRSFWKQKKSETPSMLPIGSASQIRSLSTPPF